jgi:hypothetical protein
MGPVVVLSAAFPLSLPLFEWSQRWPCFAVAVGSRDLFLERAQPPPPALAANVNEAPIGRPGGHDVRPEETPWDGMPQIALCWLKQQIAGPVSAVLPRCLSLDVREWPEIGQRPAATSFSPIAGRAGLTNRNATCTLWAWSEAVPQCRLLPVQSHPPGSNCAFRQGRRRAIPFWLSVLRYLSLQLHLDLPESLQFSNRSPSRKGSAPTAPTPRRHFPTPQ